METLRGFRGRAVTLQGLPESPVQHSHQPPMQFCLHSPLFMELPTSYGGVFCFRTRLLSLRVCLRAPVGLYLHYPKAHLCPAVP